VDDGYRSLPFPFPEEAVAPPPMEMAWTLAQVLGYLGTWSAVKAAIKATGSDPLDAFAPVLAEAWGDPQTARAIRWPLAVRLGRIEGDTAA